MRKIAFIFGTRPEAVKMAPLINAVRENESLEAAVILTGQHPTMAKEVLKWFGIEPDFDFSVERKDNSLNELTSQLLQIASEGISLSQPDIVVVQGDTASAFAGATAAFNLQIPVAHLEAGLRTNDIWSPFPEEAYRQMISRITSLNMCPTISNKKNLLAEGISEKSIMVTGNTVVDAFEVVQRNLDSKLIEVNLPLNLPRENIVLVTAHRRENLEMGMNEIAEAIAELADLYHEVNFVIPMHPNPAVRSRLLPVLSGKSNVVLVEPLDYPEFITILAKSKLILTDSGGVQEEAPILGIPALVMRENTERPEGVIAGGVRLVGANKVEIVANVRELMDSPQTLQTMARSLNPYGDGNASERCVSLICSYFGISERVSEFSYV